MPPRVSKPSPPTTYTFLADPASHPLPNAISTQVLELPFPNASSSSNIQATECVAATTSTAVSATLEEQPCTSTGRPRSRSTRGAKKREANGHIPRPPNAFILFRSATIKSQNIPDAVEGNHSRLSKIIGALWRALDKEQRDEWEAKASAAQEAHRQQYPDWRFRPGPYAMGKVKSKEGGSASARRRNSRAEESSPSDVRDDLAGDHGPSKSKGKRKEKEVGRHNDPSDGRCQAIAGFLVEGMKGQHLANAIEEWDFQQKAASESHLKSKNPVDDLVQSASQSPPTSFTSSPVDQHFLADNSDHEASPDSRKSLQSPLASITATSHSHDRRLHDSQYTKPRATIPLTQMFVNTDPAHPRPSPSIADICPPSRSRSEHSRSSRASDYSKDIGSTASTESEPQSQMWGADEFQSHGGNGFWQPWTPPSSEPSTSSDKRRGESNTAIEMGYELEPVGYDGFGETFKSTDLPSDGSEVTNWTTPAGRSGMIAAINDPLDEPPMFSTSLDVIHPTYHLPEHQSPQSTTYYNRSPELIPSVAVSYSSLAGWAGNSYPFDHGSEANLIASDRDQNISKLPHTNDWYPEHIPWSSAAGQHHQLGANLSHDEWDTVEARDS